MVVTGVGQIGCIPYQLARYNGNGSRCNEEINSAITLFNTGIKRMVDVFNRGRLPGAKFVYLDSFQSSIDLVKNARKYGRIFFSIYIYCHQEIQKQDFFKKFLFDCPVKQDLKWWTRDVVEWEETMDR